MPEGDDRRQAEQALPGNKIKALVATSALGMGFDKPDLGFVAHLGAPSSPIAGSWTAWRLDDDRGRAAASAGGRPAVLPLTLALAG